MRYIGCKNRLLNFIHEFMIKNDVKGRVFCDLFSGTATVGEYFKKQDYQIFSNDILYSSYIQQRVKIAINQVPSFDKLVYFLGLDNFQHDYLSNVDKIIDYLNRLEGQDGFIFRNYSPGGTKNQMITRMYYTDENARKIDAIRNTIQLWKNNALINEDEFSILLYALLNEASDHANTTGMFSSFLKHWCKKKTLLPLQLHAPEVSVSNHSHQVHCADSLLLLPQLKDIDILYLDPPYTPIQYSNAYHLMETLARWDSPFIKGVVGARDNSQQKSLFSSKRYALNALEQIVQQKNYKHLLLSYSNEGIIPHEEIISLFKKHGTVTMAENKYKRYSSVCSKSMEPKNHTYERLYYLFPHS